MFRREKTVPVTLLHLRCMLGSNYFISDLRHGSAQTCQIRPSKEAVALTCTSMSSNSWCHGKEMQDWSCWGALIMGAKIPHWTQSDFFHMRISHCWIPVGTSATASCGCGFNVIYQMTLWTCKDIQFIGHNCFLIISDVSCSLPNKPVNGNYTLFGGTQIQANVTYQCNTGYTLSGSPSAICQENGLWSNETPGCSRMYFKQCANNMLLSIDRDTISEYN